MITKRLPQLGVVEPQYGYFRRLLLPIYAVDQLVTLCIFAAPIALLAIHDRHLALYVGIGAYVGFGVSMQRSTPSAILLPSASEASLIRLLDGSRFLSRTDEPNEWANNRSRLRRWDNGTIRLAKAQKGLLVTGLDGDLRLIARRLSS